MISILHNSAAASAASSFNAATTDLYKVFERLATGRRIVRAADDPSGLTAANKLSAEQADIEAQLKALDFESSRLATVDGAQSAVSDMLTELDGLVVSAANSAGTSDEERAATQIQIDSIIQSIDFVANNTTFDGQKVLEGISSRSLGGATVTIPGSGSTPSETFSYTLADLATGGKLDLKSGRLEFAQASVKSAGSSIAFNRGAIGNRMKDIDSQSRQLGAQLEGVASAKSSIMDADFAAETSNLIRAQVLQQASLFTTQLALKQNSGTVLALLTGTKNI